MTHANCIRHPQPGRLKPVFTPLMDAPFIVGLLTVALLVSLPAAAGTSNTTNSATNNATTNATNHPSILVLGDSISAAYGIQRESGWVNLLAKELEARQVAATVINASISGETTGGGLARLPAAMDAHDPAIVVIELGGNDALRGYPIQRIRNNLAAMVQLVQERGSQPVLLGMQIPPNYGPRYAGAFRDLFAEVADEFAVPWVSLVREEYITSDGMLQADGIHPTAQAQPMLMQTVWQLLEALLVQNPD